MLNGLVSLKQRGRADLGAEISDTIISIFIVLILFPPAMSPSNKTEQFRNQSNPAP